MAEPKALISQVALEKPIEVKIAPGASVAQVIDSAEIPDAVMPHIVIMLNGVEVTDWDNIFLEEDDRLAVLVMPAGGGAKDVLRLVAVIAVAVAAPALVAGFGLTGTAATFATAGLTLVGTMAVNALIPPAQLSLTGGGSGSDPTFWFTGSSNQMKPYQKVPIVYGNVRMYAAAVASPIIFNAGTRSEFTGLYDFGLGGLVVWDLKIGDTHVHILGGQHTKLVKEPKLINDADPTQGYKPVPIQLMNIPTASMPLTYGMNKDWDSGVASTRPDTQAARIEIAFPSGLVKFKDNGDEEKQSVRYKIEIKKSSEPDSAYRAPSSLIGYAGDHLSLSGVTAGDPDNPFNFPTGQIILDPYGIATRDANNNIVLGAADRLTIRFQFDRPVFQFAPSDISFAPAGVATSLIFDKTPVNPKGYALVGPGDPAEGVMVVDSAAGGGMAIFDLEYTPAAGAQIIAVQTSIDTKMLLNARPADGGKPFDSYVIEATETFAINAVGTTMPPPNTNPDTPTINDTEFYQDGVTYLYYVETYSASGYLIDSGSPELWVRGTQKAITLVEAYQARGTVIKRTRLGGLSFGGAATRYECWTAVKKEFV